MVEESSKIFSMISKEFDDYLFNKIEILPGYAFSQYDTLKRIELYANSKFETGEFDENGFKKYFFNINSAPTAIAAKQTDIDTKDLKIVARDGQYFKAWLLGKELKRWMKNEGINSLLNKITWNKPKYGSVVIKRVDDNDYRVDLLNLALDQSAESLDKSSYVIEYHRMRESDLLDSWENKDEAAALAGDDGFVEILERYGLIPEDGDIDEKLWGKYGVVVVAVNGTNKEQKDQSKGKQAKDLEISGVVLHSGEVELPYKETHFTKGYGRWLGVGIVEMLFDDQIRQNELTNYKARGLQWSALNIFQTRDDAVNRNLLTDVDNGDVLSVNSEITRVDTAERNLAAYSQEESRWDANSSRRTFSQDVVSGKLAPSGTTLGAARISAIQTSSFFDLIKEDTGIFLKDFIENLVIPRFKEQNNAEHIANITDPDDLAKIDKLIFKQKHRDEVLDWVRKHKRIPSPDTVKLMSVALKKRISDKKEKKINIPKSFYKDLKHDTDLLITDEQIDVQAKQASLQVALQVIGSNPTILQDPNAKKVFFEMLDLAGINPTVLQEATADEVDETSDVPATAQRGGSTARPTALPGATGGTTQNQTVI
jgi:hypothetical protein